MIVAVKARVGIPVFVLIRPRGGGFVYSDDELDVMRRDVVVASTQGADGLVIGALDGSGGVDVAITTELVNAARGLPVTFHRAFDSTLDMAQALEMLVDIGVTRVLTSGGAATALEGAGTIARLVDQTRDRITIIAAGGIRESNVRDVVATSRVTEIHARITALARPAPCSSSRVVRLRKPLPEDENAWEEIDETRMRAMISLAQA